MRNRTGILISVLGILFAIGLVVAVSVGLAADRTDEREVSAQEKEEIATIIAAFQSNQMAFDEVTITYGDVSAYRVTVPAGNWEEYIVRQDAVLRQVALLRESGVLSLDYVDLGVESPGDVDRGIPARPAADGHFFIRINGIAKSNAEKTTQDAGGFVEDLAREKVEDLAGEYGLLMAEPRVLADQGFKRIEVKVTIRGDGDVASLADFRDRLWAEVLEELNSADGSIGLGYLEVDDADGNQLAFEVFDRIIGWNQAHSKEGYLSQN